MKSNTKQRTERVTSQRSLFQLAPIAAGCAVMLATSGIAYAQTETTNLNTVVVTGIRKGIEDAISVKKNSDSIVESISAEDIGKLPDTSVAESIARLPGVAAQRTAGRAQQISIRGMAPDFSTALLNGREQVSTGDSRGVEFDQYPSELLSGVVIYKTPDAGLVGQGLSGTVDLQTVRPLSFPKRVVAASVRNQRTGVGTGLAEGTGDRASFTYIDQFANRTIGLSLGYARFNESGAQSQRFDTWGGWTPEIDYNGGKVKTPGGFAKWVDQTKQTREGMAGTLQFKPNKNFESVFDAFYSKFDIDKTSKGFQGALPYGAGGYDPSGTLSNVTVSNGVATSGTFSNFKGVVRNDSESTKDEITSFGWNNKLKMGEWNGAVDLSRSEAKRTGGIIETTAGQAGNAATLDSISWSGFTGNNFTSVKYTTGLNYSDPNVAKLTDVEGWGGGPDRPQAGYSKLPFVNDTLNGFRVSGKRDLNVGPLNSVELGLNISDRKKVREYVEGRLVVKGSDPYAAVVAPGAGVMDLGGIKIMSWDPRGSVGSTYTVAAKLVRDIANKDWTVKEKVTTAYSKFGVDTVLAGKPVHGNVGLQIVNTDQSSQAYNVDGGPCPNDVCVLRNTDGGVRYTDVLPSSNFVWDIGGDQVVRMGLARVMARPTMSQMRASMGFGVDNNNGLPRLSGDSGNPNLKPFLADAVDISYEKYFGTKAYLSAAGFYKNLKTYILNKQDPFNFRNMVTAGTPLPPVINGSDPLLGVLTKPINGSGGSISGIELAANLPFNMLVPALDGFGMVANYSDTASSIKLAKSGVATDSVDTSSIPLPGLSKQVGSITLYFEKWGFSARWAQRFRSDFVGEVSDFTGDRKLTYIKGESIADVQLGYEVQSGTFKGLSVLFQALNVNNAQFVRYKDKPSNEVERVKYGKTYLLGVNYKL